MRLSLTTTNACARVLALPPEKATSPRARRPYDLRSTCITNWLRAGLPVAEVARRAGNSPEVIHRNYTGCLDDSEGENNRKIEQAARLTRGARRGPGRRRGGEKPVRGADGTG